jgi:SAM-dependent methyltransferase
MLRTLHRRPRGRALAPLLSALTRGRVPAGPHPRALLARHGMLRPLRERPAPAYPVRLEAPSQELIERLPDGAEDEVEERLEPELAEVRETAPEPVRRGLVLVLGAHYEVESVLDATGLTPDMPPEDVHAMARGPLAAGGSPWLADFVIGGFERAGWELARGGRVLDFGCSSARVLRVLQAWRDDVEWLGCDPNVRAVEWADEHIPGIETFPSPQDPPLPLASASLDAAYAISIWSHFGAGAAERWLAEMRRVIRPGGALLITTQGFDSLAHYMREDAILAADAERCAHALLTSGHWLGQSFPDADFGIVHPEWGMAYTSPDWLLRRALPDWRAALYEPGALEANQDLWVFIRR